MGDDRPFDLDRARRDTPAAAHIIHFNNAGAALMPQCVLDTVVGHLEHEARLGGYEAAALRADDLKGAYGHLGRLLNCRPADIAMAESATRAWDMAFFSLRLTAGDRILTSRAEYASNFIAYLQRQERDGIIIDVIDDDDDGDLSIASLKGLIDERVKLISVTHVPTNSGLVNPVKDIGVVARGAGIPFLVDASQSVGQIAIDIEDIGCDLLVGCGRKYLRGPRGTGFLYVAPALLDRMDPIFLDLHSATWTGPQSYKMQPDARRFEAWEYNVAARLGFATACAYALTWDMEAVERRVAQLGAALRSRLADVPGVQVQDRGKVLCGIVAFTAPYDDPELLQTKLNERSVNVDVSYRSSTLIDMSGRNLPTVMRASVHYYNTEDELDRFCQVLGDVLTAGK